MAARAEARASLSSLQELAASGGWQVVRVDESARVADLSAGAASLLRRFFPGAASLPGRELPAPIADRLRRVRLWGLERAAAPGDASPVVFRRGRLRLEMHVVADPVAPERGYLLIKGGREQIGAEDLAALPLTAREREVVALLAAGKTNAEIGLLLVISPRTVQKHLEHAFAKLGVETRTGAAMRAMAAMDAAPLAPPGRGQG
jgi:DNA-binding CsgD family transcriptional regulator